MLTSVSPCGPPFSKIRGEIASGTEMRLLSPGVSSAWNGQVSLAA